ncbi:hypothetical protein SMD22_00420 (plasmid) [Brevibacillus halotolerans]|nr:hypothetical protein SMD22_00420 [Brevibacillus halotolerans]
MKRYFYQSIPYYDHKVFVCQGLVGDKNHEVFYFEWFKHNSQISDNNQGSYKVLILKGYRGNRITEDGNPFFDPNNPNVWDVQRGKYAGKTVRVLKKTGSGELLVSLTLDGLSEPIALPVEAFRE